MLIDEIPQHLRNTIERLELPLYIDLEENICQPPAELALGDTLMVLGLLRNYRKPVTLFFNPGSLRPLLESHPLVKEIRPASQRVSRLNLRSIDVERSGRNKTWTASKFYTYGLPVLPLDRIFANPILAHSLYYGLDDLNDRPSVFVNSTENNPLSDLLSRNKPNLIIFPLNPGRKDYFWQDQAWWRVLLEKLSKDYNLIGVGADEYGECSSFLSVELKKSDPLSTLPSLAWLFQKAQGFVGRDGGLAHLALAVNNRVVVVWDSVASYRFWACRKGINILMSNPYTMRYPQVTRLDVKNLWREIKSVEVLNSNGDLVTVDLPRKNYEEKVTELFGSMKNFVGTVLGRKEIEEEKKCVSSWMNNPQDKMTFYNQSLSVALSGALGKLKPGVGWIAPVKP